MWFLLSLVALSLLVARRSVEKGLSAKISSLTLAWLQQAFALPFIAIFMLPGLYTFYWPGQLSAHFWAATALYALCCAVDLYCYFKALSLADISFVAPLLALVGVSAILGSVLLLHQRPTILGVCGALLVLAGTLIVYADKKKHSANHKNHMKALWLILFVVALRAFYSNLELIPLRLSNPGIFNFYSSLLTVPVLLFVALLLQNKRQVQGYWQGIGGDIKRYVHLLGFVGLTYAINLTATYQAKLLTPTAGYVTAVKSAQVVPMMLVGALVYREKVTQQQWYGVALISVGLLGLAFG
ncbi:EamA family transporter [Candidatus Saccharibacteria bacterium]|nr:EamA family transporter [Candidatus Saccharibacteria bacterium]